MDTKIYKCFIASPSDTNNERKICDKVFNEINKNLGEVYHFRIESLKWENDVHPSLGNDSQNVINQQIGNGYDFFLGIMYKRFGSPTTKAGSGTEEEFNNAYDKFTKRNSSVEIMFYFNNEATDLENIDISELQKVKEFKKKVSSYGVLYCDYKGCLEFEDIKNIGPLVPDENKEKIFEKFYRDETAMSFSREGIGMGLWIAQQILDAHGSKLFYHKDSKATKEIGLNIFEFQLATVQ